LTPGRSFVNNDVVQASWRRIARAFFLGLLMAGQGRLIFHHHVSIGEPASALARFDARHHPQDSEAACPICVLAAQSHCAHVHASVAIQTPSRFSIVAILPEASIASISRIRLSDRAPPAC
jgi:hypothetical protein